MMVLQQRKRKWAIMATLFAATTIGLWIFTYNSRRQYKSLPCIYKVVQSNTSGAGINQFQLKNGTMSSVGSGLLVPNIVHYIWYENKTIEFRFDKALSILSAVKYLNPEAVYFHTNREPTGKYYQMVKDLPIFKVVYREPPTTVIKPYHETDYSNYDKVKILTENGGIYLDLDVMVTMSFDELRQYECTVGWQGTSSVCSGVIVCTKRHPFLYLWLNSYHVDHRKKWAYNSGNVPSALAKRFPDLVHIEETRIHRPSWKELSKIWGKESYSWRENYTIHTWIRLAIKQSLVSYPTPESIKTMNNTYGQIARDIYYGSSSLIS